MKHPQQKIQLLQSGMNRYFAKQLYRKLPKDEYRYLSLTPQDDPARLHYTQILTSILKNKNYDPGFLQLEEQSLRSVGVLIGLAVCDALGASTQFMPFVKSGYGFINQEGFQDVRTSIQNQFLDKRAGEIGIWTDDCSMALCIADSIILNRKLDPQHVRYLFLAWFFHGLNNGGRPFSIGLGGNIKISFEEFIKKQTDFANQGDKFNNGNGSLMRLAPIPLAFQGNLEKAMYEAERSSKTTHNGEEASECCRLLSAIIVSLIKRGPMTHPKTLLLQVCDGFKTKSKTVDCLAKGIPESQALFDQQVKQYGDSFTKFNKSVQDRKWNWREKQFTYSPTRELIHPGYVGSYCMDALAMSLHTVMQTNNFKQVALMNANMGGDCDTVGAIAGQIAGAIYGLDGDMLKLYMQMEDCKQKRFEVFIKAYKLIANQ